MPHRDDAINNAVRGRLWSEQNQNVDYHDIRERVRRGDLGGLDRDTTWEALSDAAEGFDYDISEGYSEDRGTDTPDVQDSSRLSGLLGEFEKKFGTPDYWKFGPVGTEGYDYDVGMENDKMPHEYGSGMGNVDPQRFTGYDPNENDEEMSRHLSMAMGEIAEKYPDAELLHERGDGTHFDLGIPDGTDYQERYDAVSFAREAMDRHGFASWSVGDVCENEADNIVIEGDSSGGMKSDGMKSDGMKSGDMMGMGMMGGAMMGGAMAGSMMGQASMSPIDSSATPGDFDGDGISDVKPMGGSGMDIDMPMDYSSGMGMEYAKGMDVPMDYEMDEPMGMGMDKPDMGMDYEVDEPMGMGMDKPDMGMDKPDMGMDYEMGEPMGMDKPDMGMDMGMMEQAPSPFIDSSVVPGDFDGDGTSDITNDADGDGSPDMDYDSDMGMGDTPPMMGTPASSVIDLGGIPSDDSGMDDLRSDVGKYKAYEAMDREADRSMRATDKGMEYGGGMSKEPMYRARGGRGKVRY